MGVLLPTHSAKTRNGWGTDISETADSGWIARLRVYN